MFNLRGYLKNRRKIVQLGKEIKTARNMLEKELLKEQEDKNLYYMCRTYFREKLNELIEYSGEKDLTAPATRQVIVIRKDLTMRKGKMIAQGAHASVISVLQTLESEITQTWLKNSFAKICLYVNSEEELLALIAKAAEESIPCFPVYACFPVYDNGVAEFHGVKTLTCAAFGPSLSSKLTEFTKDLKLL